MMLLHQLPSAAAQQQQQQQEEAVPALPGERSAGGQAPGWGNFLSWEDGPAGSSSMAAGAVVTGSMEGPCGWGSEGEPSAQQRARGLPRLTLLSPQSKGLLQPPSPAASCASRQGGARESRKSGLPAGAAACARPGWSSRAPHAPAPPPLPC